MSHFHHCHHQSLKSKGHWSTTDDFKTSFTTSFCDFNILTPKNQPHKTVHPHESQFLYLWCSCRSNIISPNCPSSSINCSPVESESEMTDYSLAQRIIKERLVDNSKEWTSLPMTELFTMPSWKKKWRKKLEEDLYSVVHQALQDINNNKTRKQAMNGRTFSQNPRKREKRHHHK